MLPKTIRASAGCEIPCKRPAAQSATAANRTFGSNHTTGNRNMKRAESISSANEREWPW